MADKTHAEIVKCFNTTGFENMLNPIYKGEAIDMFMAGNSEKAKSVAAQLTLDTGPLVRPELIVELPQEITANRVTVSVNNQLINSEVKVIAGKVIVGIERIELMENDKISVICSAI